MGRKPKRSKEQLDGVLILRKPSGPTSTDCLNAIKRRFRQFKIGHAGTLDPLAEGVLPVMLGKATKTATYLTGEDKTYSGTLRLGITTDTYDIQGEVLTERPAPEDPQVVRDEIYYWNQLTEQEVPAYSAAKHKGKPLYELARAGEEVPVKRKAITIIESQPLEVTLPDADFRVRCSAGTYIRSLVHSLGTRLECGATLTRLLRESSGPFGLEQAHDLDEVLEDELEQFTERVIPMADALPHWPSYRLSEALAGLVKNGTRLPVNADGDLSGKEGDRALFLTPEGDALALVEAAESNGKLLWGILRGLW